MVQISLASDSVWNTEQLAGLADQPRLRLEIADSTRAALSRSAEVLRNLVDRGEAVYGWTTGFGPHVGSGAAKPEPHAQNLLEHLAVGAGPDTPRRVVRAAILLRCLTLSRARSGVRPEMCAAYASLLSRPEYPSVPVSGSLGASGDLVPLAHIARILAGRGTMRSPDNDTRLPAAEYLRLNPRAAFALNPREALALVNGTSFSTAWAALALERGQHLLMTAERLAGRLYAVLGCSHDAMDEALHAAKGHPGQTATAAAVRAEIQRAPEHLRQSTKTERPLQEIYSLRCVPQVLGAVRDQLEYARHTIETEMNGVDDNPLIFAEQNRLLHGGNFFAQHVAFAGDAVGAALTQSGLLAERQLDDLLNPTINGGAPLLLAPRPGATSGLAGLQLTITAIAAEMRSHARSHATGTIPTNAGNQDIVPMAAEAARVSYEQNERLAYILAGLHMAVEQLAALRDGRRGADDGLPEFAPLTSDDRELRSDLERIAAAFLNERGPSS